MRNIVSKKKKKKRSRCFIKTKIYQLTKHVVKPVNFSYFILSRLWQKIYIKKEKKKKESGLKYTKLIKKKKKEKEP